MTLHVHLAQAERYLAAQRWGDAAEAYERALAADPNCAAAFEGLGLVARNLGERGRAAVFFLRAVECDRQNPKLVVRFADELYAAGNWSGAELCYRRALDLYEAELDAREQGGAAPHDLAPFAARFIEGGSPLELADRLALCCLRQDKLEDAIALYQELIHDQATPAPLYVNLAYALERLGDLTAALDAARQAAAADPSLAEGHNMLGVIQRGLHDFAAARDCFARACQLDPQFALARFNMATIDLAQGNYVQGWANYEARRALLPLPHRSFDAPEWRGEPITGQRLLVHAEQGLGDTLQFCRFLPLAQQRSGARVVLEAPAPLVELLSGMPGVDQVVPCEDQLPAFDAHIPLPSLPGVLGIAIEGLPRDVPYLAASCERNTFWHRRLEAVRAARAEVVPPGPAAEPPLCVGMAWRGNPRQSQDHVRSCPLALFARLARVPGVQWFILQKEAPPQEWEELARNWPGAHPPVVLADELHDFADTAGLIHQLDLVITVDTAVAHLAGAMGHAVWTLLPHTPDWRWQMGRDDSLWYPTMRLFRQSRRNDWDSVIDKVAAALAQLVAAASFDRQNRWKANACLPAA